MTDHPDDEPARRTAEAKQDVTQAIDRVMLRVNHEAYDGTRQWVLVTKDKESRVSRTV